MAGAKIAPVAGLLRYAMAVTGPIGSAGAQFLLSFVLLKTLEPDAFGRFSFLLVTAQLSWGVSSALLCAPLPVILHDRDADGRAVDCLSVINGLGACASLLLFFGLCLWLGEPLDAAMLFAAYAGVSMLRWYLRAYAYAIGVPLRTTFSDLVYSLALIAGTGLILAYGGHATASAYAALLVSAAAGLVPFGRAIWARQLVGRPVEALAFYRAVWRRHSRWALFGVVTTEATANSHVYLVTLIAGAKTFAPIAASSLVIRPITVAINALVEFERPRMARQIAMGEIDTVRRTRRTFLWLLMLAWLATAAAVLILFERAPHAIFPAKYDLPTIAAGGALWMIVALTRMFRTPDSALLQAAGAFRPLAMASLWSSGLSIICVLALLIAAGPIWSIAGVLFGEALFAFATWRQARGWLADRVSGISDGAAAALIAAEIEGA